MRRQKGTTWVGASAAVLLVLAVGAASGTNVPSPPTAAAASGSPSLFRGLGALSLSLDHLVPQPPPREVAPAPEPPPPPAPPAPPVETVIAPPPATFDAPPAPPPPPPRALQTPARFAGATPAPGTWAVVIGINDYPGQGSDLRGAVNDASDMDLALAGLGVPASNRLLLRDGQATAPMIRTALDWLAAHAGPDATAVFFYSGHVRKLDRTSEAMVGADGGTVLDTELASRLAPMQARRAWIAMVACYGAGFTEALAPGRVLTGAAPADSLAYESSLFGRSYMVQYMVRRALIERKTAPTVQAAFAYARAELTRDHPGRQPVQIDAGSGVLDLRPGANVTPGAPGAPSPPSTPPPTPSTTAPKSCFLLVCNNN
ncbi:MAG TPA: caspase family protein [Acidimicrobiales bacterium]|nr:caspase family protein [Acidimicrobiales bacterium]